MASAAQQQAAAQQAPPPPQPPPDQHALLTALTVILLSNMTLDAMAAAAAPLLAPLGIAPLAVKLAIGLTMLNRPAETQLPVGPASLQVWATEPARRAAYLLSASTRLQANPDLQAERLNFGRHLDAGRARNDAALRVDRAARSFGLDLGWYAVRDQLTTPECRAAHGSNFQAAVPPRIGYPGMPHGGTCRCLPGAPFDGGRSVDAVTAGLTHEGH